MSDLPARLLEACNGHPAASVPWPHRLLHEAADEITRLTAELAEARAEIERLRQRLADDSGCMMCNMIERRMCWGDKERLRQIIEDAPHAHNCDGSTNGVLRYPDYCNCWKSEIDHG